MAGGRLNGDPGCSPIEANDCGTDVDHAVSIVGTYNTSAQYIDGYVIRNHWSTQWGCQIGNEGGYALVTAGSNTCGIASDAQV